MAGGGIEGDELEDVGSATWYSGLISSRSMAFAAITSS